MEIKTKEKLNDRCDKKTAYTPPHNMLLFVFIICERHIKLCFGSIRFIARYGEEKISKTKSICF